MGQDPVFHDHHRRGGVGVAQEEGVVAHAQADDDVEVGASTQVISTEIYTYVEAMEYGKAHVLAGGMLVFSFFVLLSLNLLNRKEGRTR